MDVRITTPHLLYCFALFTLCYVYRYNSDYVQQNSSYSTRRVIMKHSRIHVTSSIEHEPGVTQRLPEAIIVGISKCGTRAILSFLALHPGMSFGLKKGVDEVNFFNVNYQKGLEWYRKQMPLSRPGQLTIEKSPRYFSTEGIPELIKKYKATIKLLVLVCDPIFRFGSLTAHDITERMKRNETIETVEDRIYHKNGSVRESMDMKRSCYFQNMARWYNVFPRTQILVVNGDQIRENPYVEMSKIERFLGLKKYFSPSNFYFNVTKGFYCPAEDNGEIHCLPSNKGREHPAFSELVKRSLTEYYTTCNKPFFDLVDRRFDWF